ncbi:MAG TPA: hypothetical protein VN667_11260 [Burkholderiales bacterium]|nr:hypothetical protein [Burkholderiales bacterium]
MPEQIKVRSADALRSIAMERGASVEVAGRAFNTTRDRVEKPAEVERKPATEPLPAAAPAPAAAEAVAEKIVAANQKLVDGLAAVIAERSAGTVVTGWRFKIVRGKDRLIEDVIATPMPLPTEAKH